MGLVSEGDLCSRRTCTARHPINSIWGRCHDGEASRGHSRDRRFESFRPLEDSQRRLSAKPPGAAGGGGGINRDQGTRCTLMPPLAIGG